MSIRILLADDHRLMREGLRSLLEREPDMQVVAEAHDGRSALKLTGELAPSVVVMDVAMPDLNGAEATRRLCRQYPGVRVVALSMHADRRHVAHMLDAGASAYVLKDCAFEELATAIRTAADGHVYLSPRAAGVVVRNFVRGGGASPGVGRLTPREREVLQLLAEGNSTKQIALTLGVSVKTVETHRRNVMRKLGVRSVAELTKYALREGLTSLD